MKITVDVLIKAPIHAVWRVWTTPHDIMQWNAASEDWHTPEAEIDLQEGGRFRYRMEAKDGSMGFDFEGTFTKVVEHVLIEYVMDDDRKVRVDFETSDDGVIVRETFDAESANEADQQRQGWQTILNHFSRHVAANHPTTG